MQMRSFKFMCLSQDLDSRVLSYYDRVSKQSFLYLKYFLQSLLLFLQMQILSDQKFYNLLPVEHKLLNLSSFVLLYLFRVFDYLSNLKYQLFWPACLPVMDSWYMLLFLFWFYDKLFSLLPQVHHGEFLSLGMQLQLLLLLYHSSMFLSMSSRLRLLLNHFIGVADSVKLIY